LPWWLVLWGGAATAGERGPTLSVLGFAVLGAGAALWVWLLVKLVGWWREGRKVLWPYPLVWAIGMIFTIFFAVALLIPKVRRAVTPKP